MSLFPVCTSTFLYPPESWRLYTLHPEPCSVTEISTIKVCSCSPFLNLIKHAVTVITSGCCLLEVPLLIFRWLQYLWSTSSSWKYLRYSYFEISVQPHDYTPPSPPPFPRFSVFDDSLAGRHSRQADLELTEYPRVALSWRSSCLGLVGAGIVDVGRHVCSLSLILSQVHTHLKLHSWVLNRQLKQHRCFLTIEGQS